MADDNHNEELLEVGLSCGPLFFDISPLSSVSCIYTLGKNLKNISEDVTNQTSVRYNNNDFEDSKLPTNQIAQPTQKFNELSSLEENREEKIGPHLKSSLDDKEIEIIDKSNRCKSCNAKIEPYDNYCSKCGSKLG